MVFKNIKKITLFFTSIFIFFIISFILLFILGKIEIKTYALTEENIKTPQTSIAKDTNLENSTITSDMTIEAGNTVDSLKVEGGTVNIKGTVNDLIVYNGTVNVYDTGTLTGTVILVGNLTKTTLNVKSGAQILDELIVANAHVTIEAGATVHDISLANDEVVNTVELDIMGTVLGDIQLDNRGSRCKLNLSGTVIGKIESIGSIVNIESNANVKNVYVTSNQTIGQVNIQSGAIVNNATVTVYGGNFGELTVESNATLNNLKVEGGIVNVQSNAIIDSAIVFGYEGYFGELTVESGARIQKLELKGGSVDIEGSIQTVIATNGSINLLENGVITTLTIKNKVDLDSGASDKGGTISKVIIEKTGILSLWNNMNILSITGEGSLELMSNITLTIGAGTSLYDLSGSGTLIIEEGGSVTVPSGKNFRGFILNSGILNIIGNITNVEKSTSKAAIINNGKLNVAGNIDFIRNTNRGMLNISHGAKVVDIESEGETVVNSGANINSLKIYGGHTYIQKSALINRATLENGILESDNKENIHNLVLLSGSFIDHNRQSHPMQASGTWIIILIISGIIVSITAIITIFFILKRKKHKIYKKSQL